MDDLLKSNNVTVVDTGLYQQVVQKFVSGINEDVFTLKQTIALDKSKISLVTFLITLKSILTDSRVIMPAGSTEVIISGKIEDQPALIWILIKQFDGVLKYQIDMISPKAELLNEKITNIFNKETMPLIKWWFEGRHGEESKDFYLAQNDEQILPEYYPDMTNPQQYLEDYIGSSQSILLIAGPPGTGKTTFLRYLISKYKLCAHVIYDENLMKKDTPFQSFLFGEPDYGPGHNREEMSSQNDIMIIEDADTILRSREQDGNKLMSRFLNISDGLIKLPNKKMVFTTNITDFGNIDNALLRPGRCFGIVHTRALNLMEAQAAAKVAGVPIPFEKREYTLAELFNQGQTVKVRTVGFGTRH